LADYRVNLEIFAGPMDLLLHLVRKEEVDIYDIPIAKITDQYIRYIEMLRQFDIDVAGDFLVMAATLMQIKSAMLLPRSPGEQLGAEDLADPRAELIRQLLEYKKFKDAANLLAAAAEEQGERFARPDTVIEQLKPAAEPTVDLDQINIWNLLEAFDAIMEATGAKFDISHITDDTPIDLYQIEILHRLQAEGPMSFERIFESRDSRLVLVGLFLAVLELIREQLTSAEQPEPSGAIYLRATTDTPAEEAVRKAILAVEVAAAAGQTPAPTESVESPRTERTQNQQPPIPVEEIPAGTASEAGQNEEDTQNRQPPIPIVEIPAHTEAKQQIENLEPSSGGQTSE
jgi:segregation and condensation protein A